jgi:hypothetical protein
MLIICPISLNSRFGRWEVLDQQMLVGGCLFNNKYRRWYSRLEVVYYYGYNYVFNDSPKIEGKQENLNSEEPRSLESGYRGGDPRSRQ